GFERSICSVLTNGGRTGQVQSGPRWLPIRSTSRDTRRHAGVALGGSVMADIERRALVKGAALGALAFTVGGTTVMLTAGQARARNVPYGLLKENEAEAIEAIGETLVPGARDAGVAHFIDQQLSVPPGEALLEARILNVRPPFANFYRAAIGAIDRASKA